MRFVTIFLTAEHTHLYKDVGMLPYSLSKYEKIKSSLVYWDNTKMHKDDFYQKNVTLVPIRYSRVKLLRYLYFIREIRDLSKKCDVINLYHFTFRQIILSFILKKINSKLVIYCKLDLNKNQLDKMLNCRSSAIRFLKNKVKFFLAKQNIDLYSVETFKFYDELRNQYPFCNRIHYIPNGFLIDDTCKQFDHSLKENIILTVGRIGTKEKNTELLINAIINIPQEKLVGWKVYLVGPSEPHFLKYIELILIKYPYLKDVLIITGNIEKKEKLYALYGKAKVFCLPSRWESFGLVLLEAMYFKNYIITTDFPAAFDITDFEKCGKIIESENSDALQRALEECLDGKIHIEANGKLAHQRVVGFFDWKIIARRIISALQSAY